MKVYKLNTPCMFLGWVWDVHYGVGKHSANCEEKKEYMNGGGFGDSKDHIIFIHENDWPSILLHELLELAFLHLNCHFEDTKFGDKVLLVADHATFTSVVEAVHYVYLQMYQSISELKPKDLDKMELIHDCDEVEKERIDCANI
jgi:hypothetical protein